MIPLENVHIYFSVILSGFITVWIFRYLTNSKKTTEFEYLGLSAFWGLFILGLGYQYLKWHLKGDIEKVNAQLSNPLSIGFIFSIIFGFTLGLIGSVIAKPMRKLIERCKKM